MKDTTKFCSRSCNMYDKHKKYRDKINEASRKVMLGNKFRLGLPSWNKGKELHYEVWNKGKKGLQIAWNKGEKHTPEAIERMKVAQRKVARSGKDHWNWQGGISEKNHRIRNSREYKDWRMKVFQRDRFSCVICGYRSVKKRDIRADHIKPFCNYPKLRFDVDNGRTLCLKCDLKFGWNCFRENNPKCQK